jgi:hypothetical protein
MRDNCLSLRLLKIEFLEQECILENEVEPKEVSTTLCSLALAPRLES